MAACGVAATAQTATAQTAANQTKLNAPLVSIAQAQKLALPDDIQIHLRDVTLRAALQELERQSGLPFDLSDLPADKLEAKLSIDIDTPAVMRALDAIADEANFKLKLDHGPSYDRWHVRENQGTPTRYTPDFVDGSFAARLLKVDVSLFKSLDLDNPEPAREQNDHLNLTMKLTADPGWPIGGLPVLRATRADDEKGRSLLAAEGDKTPDDNSGFQDIWSGGAYSTLQLLPPAADARRIAHLEGESLYYVALKRALWEVPDLLADKAPTYTFKIGETPATATISNARIENERARFELKMSLPQGLSWQDFSGNLYSLYGVVKWMKMEDADGTQLVANGDGGGGYANEVSSYVTFSLPPAASEQEPKLQLPLKFTFSPPTDWVRAAANFEFNDVPLP